MKLPANAKSVFTKIDMQYTKLHGNMTTPCWPFKGAVNSSGRPYVSIGGKKYLAYRLTYALVNGENALPDDKSILHQCDNQLCCRPEHMKVGDHNENMKEMRDRERHGLPHHTVRAIRKLEQQSTLTHKEIGKQFGIARSTVSEIISGKKYQDVE